MISFSSAPRTRIDLIELDLILRLTSGHQFLTLAQNLFDYNEQMENELGGIITRATHLSNERGATLGLGPEDMLPSPTKAYLTISQVSFSKHSGKYDERMVADTSRRPTRRRRP